MLEGTIAYVVMGILLIIIFLIFKGIKALNKKAEKALEEEKQKIIYEIEFGNLNSYDENGYTLLIRAIHYNFYDLVEKLIKKGADVNFKSSSGAYPIHYAVITGNINILKILYENGANLNVKDNMGVTPLWIAARYDRDKIAKFLLENGANIDEIDSEGYTALMITARQGNYSTFWVLMDYGANIFIKSKTGETAYDISEKYLASNLGAISEQNFYKEEIVRELSSLMKGREYTRKEYVREYPTDEYTEDME